MNIRMWGISLFMFLSTVSAVGQTANRYLKAPLPDEWEESGQVFQQTLPVDDYWWKSFRDTKPAGLARRQAAISVPLLNLRNIIMVHHSV